MKRSRRVEDRKLDVITRLSCPYNSINARRNVKDDDVVCVFIVNKESRRINAKRQKKLVFFVHPRPAQPRQHNQPWPLLLQRPLQPHLGGLLVLRGPQVQDPVQESHCEYIPSLIPIVFGGHWMIENTFVSNRAASGKLIRTLLLKVPYELHFAQTRLTVFPCEKQRQKKFVPSTLCSSQKKKAAASPEFLFFLFFFLGLVLLRQNGTVFTLLSRIFPFLLLLLSDSFGIHERITPSLRPSCT